MLADFLLNCLDEEDLELKIYALKSLFLLLQKHRLDCPQYYTKLYAMLLPQTNAYHRGSIIKTVFNMDFETKQRFLRLLDLSLRA